MERDIFVYYTLCVAPEWEEDRIFVKLRGKGVSMTCSSLGIERSESYLIRAEAVAASSLEAGSDILFVALGSK